MSEMSEKIFAADDLPREKVVVPEWDVTLWMGTMMSEEKDAFEISMSDTQGGSMRNFRARLVARTALDQTGERVFTDAEAAALGRKSGNAMSRVFNVAARLNRFLAEDLKELVGNSDATRDAVPNGP